MRILNFRIENFAIFMLLNVIQYLSLWLYVELWLR